MTLNADVVALKSKMYHGLGRGFGVVERILPASMRLQHEAAELVRAAKASPSVSALQGLLRLTSAID